MVQQFNRTVACVRSRAPIVHAQITSGESYEPILHTKQQTYATSWRVQTHFYAKYTRKKVKKKILALLRYCERLNACTFSVLIRNFLLMNECYMICGSILDFLFSIKMRMIMGTNKNTSATNTHTHTHTGNIKTHFSCMGFHFDWSLRRTLTNIQSDYLIFNLDQFHWGAMPVNGCCYTICEPYALDQTSIISKQYHGKCIISDFFAVLYAKQSWFSCYQIWKRAFFSIFFCLVIDLQWNGFDLDFYCYLTWFFHF